MPQLSRNVSDLVPVNDKSLVLCRTGWYHKTNHTSLASEYQHSLVVEEKMMRSVGAGDFSWRGSVLRFSVICIKDKGFTYSLLSVEPRVDPGVQAVSRALSPQATISHQPGGRLPLLSAKPAVTFPAAEHHRPLAGTKLYCLVTEAHRCEQLAQGYNAAFTPSRIWTHDLLIASPTLYPLHHHAILHTLHITVMFIIHMQQPPWDTGWYSSFDRLTSTSRWADRTPCNVDLDAGPRRRSWWKGVLNFLQCFDTVGCMTWRSRVQLIS